MIYIRSKLPYIEKKNVSLLVTSVMLVAFFFGLTGLARAQEVYQDRCFKIQGITCQSDIPNYNEFVDYTGVYCYREDSAIEYQNNIATYTDITDIAPYFYKNIYVYNFISNNPLTWNNTAFELKDSQNPDCRLEYDNNTFISIVARDYPQYAQYMHIYQIGGNNLQIGTLQDLTSTTSINGLCGNSPYTCNDGVFSSSTINNIGFYNWNCNGLYGGNNTSCIYSTSTIPFIESSECGITSGELILGCMKNAFAWAVNIDPSAKDDFVNLMDRLKTKAPIGYVTSIIEVFRFQQGMGQALVLIASDNPLMIYIFNPLRAILAIIIYVFSAVWLFNRVKNIHI